MKKKIRLEMLGLILYAAVLTAVFFQPVVGKYNTTIFAFSYRWGFLSRGLTGTVFQLLDQILPWNLLTYRGTQIFSMGMDLLFVLALLAFFYVCLKRSEESLNHGMAACMLVLSTFAFPEYVTFVNMGRIDSIMAVLTILAVYLLIKEKWEWLVVPISAVGVCVHQGYVLMFAGVIWVLLLLKAIDKPRERKAKYILLLGSSVLICGVLFLYFNYFSHTGNQEVYDSIYELAASISCDGTVHKQLIEHEVLGIDPSADEWATHVFNFREIAVFAILTIPYWLMAAAFFLGCIRQAEGFWGKIKYLAIALGPAILLMPDFLIKIDYGRWVFCLVFDYFILILALLACGDRIVTDQFHGMAQRLGKHRLLCVALLIYPLVLTPMGDIWITKLSKIITSIVLGIPEGAMIF